MACVKKTCLTDVLLKKHLKFTVTLGEKEDDLQWTISNF